MQLKITIIIVIIITVRTYSCDNYIYPNYTKYVRMQLSSMLRKTVIKLRNLRIMQIVAVLTRA